MTNGTTKKCLSCGKEIFEKDTIALNKKMLGRSINKFFCMDCLANYLDTSVDHLQDKVEEFKEQGCKLFE